MCRRSAAGTTGYYLFDHQGNASEVVVSGAVHVHSGYNAWGSVNHLYPIPTNSDSFLKFGFNARWGYVSDASTGLSYCQNRYYDPQTGRFLTRDPIGYAGGANLYGYCGGNPVLRQDATGNRTYTLYMLVDHGTSELAKWGISGNIARRYSEAYLEREGLKLIPVLEGTKSEVKAVEQGLIKLFPGDPRYQREFWAGFDWAFREGSVMLKFLPAIAEALEFVGKDPISLGLGAGNMLSSYANPVMQQLQERTADKYDSFLGDEPPIFRPSLEEKYPR